MESVSLITYNFFLVLSANMNREELMTEHSILPFGEEPLRSVSDFFQKMFSDPLELLKDPIVFIVLGTVTFVVIWFFAEYSSWGRIPEKV